MTLNDFRKLKNEFFRTPDTLEEAIRNMNNFMETLPSEYSAGCQIAFQGVLNRLVKDVDRASRFIPAKGERIRFDHEVYLVLGKPGDPWLPKDFEGEFCAVQTTGYTKGRIKGFYLEGFNADWEVTDDESK